MSAASGAAPYLGEVDPFDLPDWLGTAEVVWVSASGLRSGHLVDGALRPEPADLAAELACDLLAVDAAYPAPVAGEEARTLAHQAWQRGEVHLAEREGRLTLAVPGVGFSADRVLDAMSRLARAVGATPQRYQVCLRIGEDARRTR